MRLSKGIYRKPWTPAQTSARIAQLRRLARDCFGFVPARIVPVARGTVEKPSSGKKRSRVIRQRWSDGEITALAAPLAVVTTHS